MNAIPRRISPVVCALSALVTLACGTGALEAPVDAGGRARNDAEGYPLVDGSNGLPAIDPDYVRDHFDELLVGTWLIGWYGGYDHFSWLRLRSASDDGQPAGRGTFTVLSDPAAPPTMVPYWACNGDGPWEVTARPQTVDLRLDALGCAREVLVFEAFHPLGTGAEAAYLEARITAAQITGSGYGPDVALVGRKHPNAYCDAAFAACGSPY